MTGFVKCCQEIFQKAHHLMGFIEECSCSHPVPGVLKFQTLEGQARVQHKLYYFTVQEPSHTLTYSENGGTYKCLGFLMPALKTETF